MDPSDTGTQLVVVAVFLVVIYFIVKTCCPVCCQPGTEPHEVVDVTVEPRCTCSGLISGVVTYVVDGDGFKFFHSCPGLQLDDVLNVRLAGIDAPEMGKPGIPGQPFALEAKEFLKKLVHRKSLNLNKIRTDQYGRILAMAFLPGPTPTNVNLEMVKNGFAVVYKGGGAVYGGFFEQFCEAQEQAKRVKKGMWSVPNLQSPMEYKREHRLRQPIVVV